MTYGSYMQTWVLCITKSDGPLGVQVMVAILKDMGINDFEPRVINQMLEFSYRCNVSVTKQILPFSQT